jgi:N-methylhydantoinase B
VVSRSALTDEILRHGLVAAAEEASIVVVRAAYSAFIVEGSDASAAVLDRHGRLVAQSTATTLAHSASLRACLPAVIATYGLDAMAPGDVFALNDVYLGGIHANDIVVFQPVFVDGRLEFFCGTLIHVADLGGMAAGGMASTATEVLHEGLQLPPVRLARRGEPVDDMLRVLGANSRTPTETVGDVQALMAGTTVAARRLGELVDELGPEMVVEGVDRYLVATEAAVRRSIAALPDGTYRDTF